MFRTFPVESKMMEITVTFHVTDHSFSFSGSISETREISVPAGLQMILLKLETDFGVLPIEGPLAKFPTYPIEWLTETDEPSHQPQAIQVQRHGDFLCTILDFNSVPASHKFNVLATFRGRTYGSDPTIVNEPPIQ